MDLKETSVWKSGKISIRKIADALFSASNGDKRYLNTKVESCKFPGSVWGHALKLLAGDEGQFIDRLILYRIWSGRRKNVEGEFDLLTAKKRLQQKKAEASTGTLGCYCESHYNPKSQETRLKCDICDRLVHKICADFNNELEANFDGFFSCGICSGDLELPSLLDSTNIEETSGLSEVDSNVELTGKDKGPAHFPQVEHSNPRNLLDLSFTIDEETFRIICENFETGEDSETNPGKLAEEQFITGEQTNKSGHPTKDSHFFKRSSSPSQSLVGDADDFLSDDEAFNSPHLSSGSDSEEERKHKPSSPTKSSSQAADDFDEDECFLKPSPSAPKLDDLADDDEGNQTTDTKESNQADKNTLRVKLDHFELELEPSDLAKIFKLKPGKSGKDKSHYEIQQSWTNTLARKFDSVNKSCVLTFLKKFMKEPYRTPFFFAYADCKASGCTARWKLEISKCPGPNESATLIANLLRGEVKHDPTTTTGRFLRGDYQTKPMSLLQRMKPLAAKKTIDASADMEARTEGRTTEMKNVKAYQNLRQKMERDQDLDKDVIIDLVKTKKMLEEAFPDNEVPGYLQTIQFLETKIVLFSYKQMHLLEILKQKGPVSLFLDATSGLVRPLGTIYGTKPVYLYTILLPAPVANQTPVPVCEMLTSDHTHSNIYTWMFAFFHLFEKRCGAAKHYNVLKFEIDFSKPLMSSLVRLFYGGSLASYINEFWALYEGCDSEKASPLDIFPIHVCRFHVVKAVRKKILQIFQKRKGINNENVVDFYVSWIRILVRSKDLYSFDRRVKEVARISSFQSLTPAVVNSVNSLHLSTTRTGKPWKQFTFDKSPKNSAFWNRTAFGQYAHAIFAYFQHKNLENETAAKDTDLQNPYFSTDFGDYLRTYFLPYYPLISYMVFDACGIEVQDDTNNRIESYFGLLKTNIYQQKANKRISRFVKDQAETVKGLCNSTLGTLSSLGYKIKVKPSKDPSAAAANVRIDKEQKEAGKQNDPSGNFNAGKTRGNKPKKAQSEDTKATKAPASFDGDEEDDPFVSPSPPFKGKNYERTSPERQVEVFKKPIPRKLVTSVAADFISKTPLVPWGGHYLAKDGKKVRLRNTCSIDIGIQALVCLRSRLPEKVNGFLEEMSSYGNKFGGVEKAVQFACMHMFDKAKTIWMNDVMGLSPDPSGNMEESDFNSVYRHIGEFFPVRIYHKCANDECTGHNDPTVYPEVGTRRWKWEHSNVSYVMKPTPEAFADTINNLVNYATPCFCGSVRLVETKFNFTDRPFIFYPLLYDHLTNMDEIKLQRIQVLRGVTYDVFAYTCIKGDLVVPKESTSMAGDCKQDYLVTGSNEDKGLPRYVVKIIFDNKKMVFDGQLEKPYIESKCPHDKVTSGWLIPRSPS